MSNVDWDAVFGRTYYLPFKLANLDDEEKHGHDDDDDDDSGGKMVVYAPTTAGSPESADLYYYDPGTDRVCYIEFDTLEEATPEVRRY